MKKPNYSNENILNNSSNNHRLSKQIFKTTINNHSNNYNSDNNRRIHKNINNNRNRSYTSVVASIDAPYLSNNSTTLILFFLQAMCNGVNPLRARALGSALRSSSSLATLTWPQWAATCKAVK